MPISDQRTPPPQLQADVRGKLIATICCWFLGLGSLLAWNSILTISDYYYQVFPRYHPSRVLPLTHLPCAVCTMIYLAWNESRIGTRSRNIGGFALFATSSFLLIVLDLASHGKGHVTDFVVLCVLCGSFGVGDALVQGGIIGDLSFMDPVFLQSFFGGLAASGALTSGLRLFTKTVFDKRDQGLRHGALLFLAISTAMEFLCVLLYAIVFPRLPVVKYYRTKAALEGSKTVAADLAAAGIHQDDDHDGKSIDRLSTRHLVLQNWDYGLDLYVIYALTLSIYPGFLYENTGTHGLGSWYAVVLVAMYNCCDLISRYTPLINFLRIRSRRVLLGASLARVLFIPAFYFTAKYAAQGWMIMLISLLGLTHGHITVCVMMAYPQGYKGPEQNALGNALYFFLLSGLFSGVAFGCLWIIGNGSF